jgi:uncharacterized protein
MSIADEIGKLNELRQSEAITELEYEKAKEAILAENHPGFDAADYIETDVNQWGMFIHLSQFCGYLVPLAGLIVPIMLWQMKKKESEIIDQHGRIVLNWIITEFILAIVFVILCFVVIGIPLLIVLGVIGIIFPIVGAVKANNGEVWQYPCSIKFFN